MAPSVNNEILQVPDDAWDIVRDCRVFFLKQVVRLLQEAEPLPEEPLRAFAKAHPLLVVKGGYFDGAPLTAEEVNKLADLESREVLLAKLAGAMKASLTKAAYLFNAPLSKAVRTVDALREKQESAA